MTFRKVYYVNIISYSSSVRCVVIVSEHAEFFQLSYCNLCYIRHQVIRNTIWIFADCTALMRTDRIEVTKENYIPLRICLLNVCKDLLQHGFCPAIRICTLTLRTLLCDRNDCRVAVYCCRRRENNIFYIMFSHNIYES